MAQSRFVMILQTLFFYLGILPLTGFLSALALFSRFDKSGRWGDLMGTLWGRAALWLAGVRPEVDLSAIEPGRTYLFMCNHQSLMDIPVLFSALRRHNIRFVAKKSLYSIPLYGPALRESGHIEIERENSRKAMKSIDVAATRAREGISVLIFPEGTRGQDLAPLQEFKIGGVILALKAGLPVVPLVLTGPGRVLPRGRWMLGRAPVRLKALPPIDPAAYSLKERDRFKDDLHRLMSDAYQELTR